MYFKRLLLLKQIIMKFNFNKFFSSSFLVATAFAMVTSCNKDVEDATPIKATDPSGQTLLEIINADANLTFLKAAVARAATNTTFGASLSTLFADRTGVFTLYAPTDAAFQLSGIPSVAVINALRPGYLDTVLRYHIVGGQKITTASIPGDLPAAFPNVQLPTLLTLAAPSATLPPGLRMSIFASRRSTNTWANNIPVTQADIQAANGVIHKTATIVAPGSAFVWNRIDADPTLTYFKAAIKRADEGVATASKLETAFQNPAANFTVLVPNDNAMRTILTGLIYQALLQQPGMDPATALATATSLASTPAVFTNPLVTPVLTQQMVQGIVAYHLLAYPPIVSGTNVAVNGMRVFSVNIPTASTNVKTFLNRAVVPHPGVNVQATFGATGVTAATVKGAFNGTPSNILINPTPGTGTSDQHYINGVIHIIDQVLLPQ
jgi:uncharacterized surface protein with fasciclin (FAS1) repeats